MQITGEWSVCDDGITRPTLLAKVQDAAGQFQEERFLIDTGADRTVLSARLLQQLGVPIQASPPSWQLQGVGGAGAFVTLPSVLEFIRDGGSSIHIRGTWAAFTSLTATDFSILGRDILDLFDLIVSRSRQEILLLTGHHRYAVSGP